jgi:hypothetical protein
MKVGFFNRYHGSTDFMQTIHVVLADMMIRSVRKVMPSVEIIQFTDERSPRIMGVDSVRRIASTEPMAVQCVTHYAACVGDWLLLDTDVILQRDVHHVFDDPFDVAVCDRDGTKVDGEDEDFELFKVMPYNIGVMFSRSPSFWESVKTKLLLMSDKKQQWMGNQIAACEVIKDGHFDVKIIPGIQYNYPPRNFKDRGESASIIHFKGPLRKQMMLDRFQEV